MRLCAPCLAGLVAVLVAGSDWPVFRGDAVQTGAAKGPLPAELQPSKTMQTGSFASWTERWRSSSRSRSGLYALS